MARTRVAAKAASTEAAAVWVDPAQLVPWAGNPRKNDGNVARVVEVSAPMLEACRSRFAQEAPGKAYALDLDLRKDFPVCAPSVVLSVLTLQFVPIEYRQGLVQRVFDALLPGGAFIVVEKVLGATASIDESLVAEYLRMKAEHGYTPEESAQATRARRCACAGDGGME